VPYPSAYQASTRGVVAETQNIEPTVYLAHVFAFHTPLTKKVTQAHLNSLSNDNAARFLITNIYEKR
jgi:hypothetical protein